MKVEVAVKSAKLLLLKNTKGGDDFHLGFVAERNIPSQGIGSSPVQRLINRRTRTLLPTTGNLLEPRNLNTGHERERSWKMQKRQALYYNTSAHDLPTLGEGDTARIKPFIQGQKEWKKGMIVERLDERSYEVETADGSSYTDVTRSISNERMSRPLSWPSRNHLKYQVILMTPVTEYIWRNRLPLRKPHASSSARTHWSKTLLGWPEPIRGELWKHQATSRDYVTWRLATEHWILSLLLAFEYRLLTTWGCFQWI